MEKKERYIQLIIKQLANETSSEENKEIVDWLEKSNEHIVIHDELVSAWTKSDNYKSDLKIDQNLAWQNLEGRIATLPNQNSRFNFTRIAQIAAMFILVLGLGVFIADSFANEDVHYQTQNSVEKIDLPDGSSVWLNSYSELHYSSGFKSREIELVGEAYFDVQHNANRPFTVEANGTEIKVLGTEFNVNTQFEGTDVEVSLFEGSVAFEADENNKLMLVPGETVQFNKALQSLVKFDTKESNTLAWKSGILEYENTSILTVLSELEEYYDKDLEVLLDSSANCVFTGRFEQMEFNEVVEILSYTYDLRYQEQGSNQYLLEIKNCH